jgi:glycosyltransferase involved in cell wall biosynthesis
LHFIEKLATVPLKTPMQDCFIYVSSVPRSGTDGQNKFEAGTIKTLLKKGNEGRKFEIKIFSATTEGEISEDEQLVLLPLNKSGYAGFIFHQFRLFCSLGSYLWSRRKSNLYMFVRYHPAMLAPLILTYIFNIRLSMRTGPVLPNLFYYNKNPSAIIFHLIKWILKLFYRKASSIVTVTEKIKQDVVRTCEIDPEKIVVVPNAADTTLFFPEPPDRGKWGLPENEFVFGFVGSLFEGQGVGTIIQALGHLKQNQAKIPFLFIVGDGEYGATLKPMSKELDVASHIIWAGNIPHEQVRSAINACDIMLAPFQKKLLAFRGSSSLKLYECLACDKPILASESKDHQFLEELNLGRMAEPDNIEIWAEALTTEAKRKDFLLQGRGEKFIKEEHSYDLLVEKFIAISFGQKLT